MPKIVPTYWLIIYISSLMFLMILILCLMFILYKFLKK